MANPKFLAIFPKTEFALELTINLMKHETNNMLKIASIAKKKHKSFLVLGVPTFRKGGGVNLAGTKSQVFPKVLF